MGKPMFDSRGSSLVENLAVILVLVWSNPFRFCYWVSKSCNGHSVLGLWVGVEPASATQAVPSPETNDE